ncbi:uncharacterized protein LOC124930947 [Impatiens glandulifera]|uniref:uncharacterized protein LOC124930947 n=1 Tax=Impatiens glandulifera TaxID=253017 RepID=UPI001FB07601|nr:uncharacterized protein LOC124930947 [Impatiens glandulifera]
MESVSVLRSIQCIGSRPQYAVERLRLAHLPYVAWPSSGQLSSLSLTSGKNFLLSSFKQEGLQAPCAKTSATSYIVNTAETSDLKNGSAAADRSQGLLGKNGHRRGTFPNGFEALILEVCDGTEITELKLKVADFEMHMRRNIEASQPSVSVALPVTTKPVIVSTTPAPPPKSSTDKVSPFTNVSAEKSTKLSALDASGASGYVIVSSPIVGSFRRGRTLKGKKQPPACKEGDVIKEGQVIGFLDQFGTELPVKSDTSGEVLRVLFKDGGMLLLQLIKLSL